MYAAGAKSSRITQESKRDSDDSDVGSGVGPEILRSTDYMLAPFIWARKISTRGLEEQRRQTVPSVVNSTGLDPRVSVVKSALSFARTHLWKAEVGSFIALFTVRKCTPPEHRHRVNTF